MFTMLHPAAVMSPEIIPVLAVLAGVSLVLGLRTVAGVLLACCAAMILLPVVVDPLLALLPDWAVLLVTFLFWAGALSMLLTLIIGRNAKDQMVGSLAADLCKWCLFFPFRVLRWMYRLCRR